MKRALVAKVFLNNMESAVVGVDDRHGFPRKEAAAMCVAGHRERCSSYRRQLTQHWSIEADQSDCARTPEDSRGDTGIEEDIPYVVGL